MPNNIQKVLNDFLEEVKTILGNRLKKIVLYGSYARGDYNKSADIDIMILTDLSDKEISEYSMKIWEKSADIEIDKGIVISPLVRNIDNFEAWSEVKPFYINIINEGVVLVGEKN
jgi:predicted nucleotidyltransferase